MELGEQAAEGMAPGLDDLDQGFDDFDEDSQQEIGQTTVGSGGSIIVNDRFHIATDAPIPDLDSPAAKAFACRDMADANHHVVALVCDGMMPPRVDDLPSFRRVERPSMLAPLEWGVSDWPGEEQRRFIIVLERPGGRRVVTSANDSFKPFSEDRITRNVIKPLVPVIRVLNEMNCPHRGIRIDNLFFQDAVLGDVTLGEGFAAPPAYSQPALFEPLDSAMCEPGGRGRGSIADDLYAFGATLALLVSGRNPLAGRSDKQIIEAKQSEGSYFALLGEARISLGLIEVIRGLLIDDPRERWTLSELDLWINGRRLSPKQPTMPPKAQRPFKFVGREFSTAPTLSNAFAKNWTAAAKAIATQPIDTWIKRGLEDDGMADAFNQAIRTAAAFGGRQGIEDRMVSRACIVLDPQAPLRLRDLRIRATALDTALLTRFIEGTDVNMIAEAVGAKLPTFWLDCQSEQIPGGNLARNNVETINYMLTRPGPGYGLERCLYELNPGCPCLSPMVSRFYVMNLNQLLPALDVYAQKSGMEGEPMDRHLAGFIASRLKHSMDQHLQGLADRNDGGNRRMSLIRLLAEVQQVTGQETPPHLAQWMLDLTEPVIQSYRNQPFRVRLTKEVAKLAEKGSLMDIAYALENSARRDKDNQGYANAVAEYTAAEQEIHKIEGGEMTKPEVIEKKGQEIAALTAAMLGSFILLLLLGYKVVSGFLAG